MPDYSGPTIANFLRDRSFCSRQLNLELSPNQAPRPLSANRASTRIHDDFRNPQRKAEPGKFPSPNQYTLPASPLAHSKISVSPLSLFTGAIRNSPLVPSSRQWKSLTSRSLPGDECRLPVWEEKPAIRRSGASRHPPLGACPLLPVALPFSRNRQGWAGGSPFLRGFGVRSRSLVGGSPPGADGRVHGIINQHFWQKISVSGRALSVASCET